MDQIVSLDQLPEHPILSHQLEKYFFHFGYRSAPKEALTLALCLAPYS